MSMKIAIDQHDAVIGVDLQNDFMPGGSLAVREGDAIVPVVNDLLECFPVRVLTRDWHPANHISFSKEPKFMDMSWPPHCIQNTPGAEFHPGLHAERALRVVSKGEQANREQYSGFQDTDLADWLRSRNVQRVFIAGLTTEYCVKSTAFDARKAGFQTFVFRDAVRGVGQTVRSEEAAWHFLMTAGVYLITSSDLACPLPARAYTRYAEPAVVAGGIS